MFYFPESAATPDSQCDQFRGFIAAQQPRFAKLVKDSGVTPE